MKIDHEVVAMMGMVAVIIAAIVVVSAFLLSCIYFISTHS